MLLNCETWAHADEGDMEAALEAIEARRRLLFGVRGEPDGWLLRDRGEVLINLGRHVDAERDLSRALSVLDGPTATCGCWGTWSSGDLDRGLYERAWAKANSAVEADAYPFMKAMSRMWRGLASLMLGRVDAAAEDFGAIPFDVLGRHPALQVGLATACLSLAKSDAEAFRHSLDAVERHLGDDWVSQAAATVYDALRAGDLRALRDMASGESEASKQVAWRVLARAGVKAIELGGTEVLREVG